MLRLVRQQNQDGSSICQAFNWAEEENCPPVASSAELYHDLIFRSLGNRNVNKPNNGRKATLIMVGFKPMLSASQPNTTEPMAPIPNDKPTISPDTVPIFPGSSSWA